MSFAQTGTFVHFEVQLDEKAVIELVRRKFVYGHATPLRDGAYRFEKIFVAFGARLDVHHYVRRNDLRDLFFYRFGRRVGLLEAGRARHAEGYVHEIALPRAA